MLSFSAQTRTDNLARMAEDKFDVLVIGGGITGTGIALDAAARGLSVALVEKDDFASGTSGRSSRLVHGGLRYLEHGEFGLVRESLRERGILYRLAPHLVRPVPMYMLAGDRRRQATYRAGLTAYEMLAAGRNIGYHRAANAEQVRAALPGLGGASRGVRYFECQVDDARLTIEVARTAQASGAVLANHARVTGLLGGGRVTGAAVTDEMTGQRFEVRARAVVNAAGVWAGEVAGLAADARLTHDSADTRAADGARLTPGKADDVRLTPSKGVHLVFAPGTVPATAALVAPSAAGDGRYIFIVPWEDRAYAGTTDTPYDGDLDHPGVGDADRDYILAAVAGLFPGVTERDVVASWAGLRPLLGSADGPGDASTSDLSRRHMIFTGPPGLFTITGGKLTTYRAMAEDLVDRVAEALGGAGPCRTREIALGLHGSAAAAVRLARDEVTRLGLPPRTAARLVQRYGDDWRDATQLIAADRPLGEPVVTGLPVLAAEVVLAGTREMALTDEDVLVRRTRLTTRDGSLSLAPSGGPLPGLSRTRRAWCPAIPRPPRPGRARPLPPAAGWPAARRCCGAAGARRSTPWAAW
jgi:glycerol-3-phosphate dehydrogenase